MDNLKIKICGMRNPENIEAVSALNPDFLGLIFYPKSKRFVSDKEAKTINPVIPAHIKKVGVFVNELLPDIIKRINLFGLEYIQLHGDEPVEYCSELKSIGVKIIKSFGINESFDFKKTEAYFHYCDYFLFDTKSPAYGGTGQKFSWGKLEEYSLAKPIFLSGGIGPDDATEIKKIADGKIFAVDINSKFEIEPAMKNTNHLEQFINEIRNNKI